MALNKHELSPFNGIPFRAFTFSSPDNNLIVSKGVACSMEVPNFYFRIKVFTSITITLFIKPLAVDLEASVNSVVNWLITPQQAVQTSFQILPSFLSPNTMNDGKSPNLFHHQRCTDDEVLMNVPQCGDLRRQDATSNQNIKRVAHPSNK